MDHSCTAERGDVRDGGGAAGRGSGRETSVQRPAQEFAEGRAVDARGGALIAEPAGERDDHVLVAEEGQALLAGALEQAGAKLRELAR